MGYGPWVAESDTTEQLSTYALQLELSKDLKCEQHL